MHKIEINNSDLIKLKELVKEFGSFYEKINENGDAEPWDFDDLDEQLEISNEIIGIIEPLLNKL